ncbi:MAG: hypothetical protein HYX34_09990 [Actinobacteria bacterium]|nr:hypothetical protein [Actinomycetota bacterium]
MRLAEIVRARRVRRLAALAGAVAAVRAARERAITANTRRHADVLGLDPDTLEPR